MDLNKLIKDAHENAIEKGFYECPECDMAVVGYKCERCNNTGIDPNKNIPELLMLVITEISEAVEALKCGKHIFENDFYKNVDVFEFIKNDDKQKQSLLFEINIKDTFEDEIADVFIRLADLCGYLGIEIDENEYAGGVDCAKNKVEALFDIVEMIVGLKKVIRSIPVKTRPIMFLDIFNQINFFCERNKIDIEKHIEEKMQYNKTRPKKHGKEF